MSEDNDSSAERSHEPSPQRLEDARKRGDIAKSVDLSAASAYLGFALALGVFGADVAMGAGDAMVNFFARADTIAPRVFQIGGVGLVTEITLDALSALAPIFVVPFFAVLAVIIAQQAFVVAPEKLVPKLSRISPIEQAKNKFGVTGLMEFLKAATKLTAISIVFYYFMLSEVDRIVGFVRAPPDSVPAEMSRMLFDLTLQILVVATVIAAIDYFWQRHNHLRKLRMTFQEVRDEAKKSEGDPMLKSQRRQRGEEIVRNKMMHEVPTASVVVVNPTHYAVALRWSRSEMSAPVVVAKGVDEVALRIRKIAEDAGVPIHSDPPTARALEATVELGAEIDAQHYQAVAAAIRFAEAAQAKARRPTA